eukprot:CAMPEP_0119303256 /NCGR_PEP_ID=MMETSP1333-20130426/4709_1 /TAXON_ID=418940 /ORGANISM="Scyphosphaera apsteinii, Strain RCC1455" /LENGTH=487 /DNA_ID=CAMNT_0007305873 /DNA_START=44 /DNA_END=1507 /DNA_ORIENTATION=+
MGAESFHSSRHQIMFVMALLMASDPVVAFGLLSQKPNKLGVLQARPNTQPVLAASAAEEESKRGGASLSSSTINLAKNIVGSGVLALAAGVAAFSGSPVALVPSMALLLLLGGVSGYTFSLIARVGAAVGASTYRDTWAMVFPKNTAVIPAATVTFMTLAAGLSYAIIIGDASSSIAMLAGAPTRLQSPNVWIVFFSVFVLLPLCLLRDLSSLAFGSVLGTAGTLYTALFMALRCLDGSYAAGGKFHASIADSLQPLFITGKPVLNMSIFVLVSMLATAFLAHYNAPKMYEELAPPKDGGSKLRNFNLVCAGGFGAAALLCGAIMSAGYLTFGAASQGLILNNYATSDSLAFLARLGIGLSIIFSYPLNFAGLRDGLLSLFGWSKFAERGSVHVASTVLLIALLNGSALFLKDLGLIAALGGAILGSALVYIYPALMFIANARKQLLLKRAAGYKSSSLQNEMYANYGLVGLGSFLAVVGAVMSLKG